ncbi:M20/M25/M40 family metallo-hydrolase [Candidatus Nomurabacteria bacterium]|nr:M20/M25/M40 family metallo-hydrolase [Candidatus Nomurabacteria bacterium]
MSDMQTTFIDLLKCKTITKNHEEVKRAFDIVESFFPKDIFEVHYFESNGFVSQVVSFKGVDWKDTDLLLNGHMDVVPAPDEDFDPRVDGDKIFARGTSDMKGGIVAMMYALRDIGLAGKSLNCALLLNSDEEIGGQNGAGYFVDGLKAKSKFVLVADGPQFDEFRITAKEKGVVWLEVKTKGKSSHSSRPWLGDNALDKLIKALADIKRITDATEIEDWKTTANIGFIGTDNQAYNKVPDNARAVVDIRFTEDIALHPEQLVEKLQAELGDEVELNIIVGGSVVNTDIEHPFVKEISQIASQVYNKDIQVGFSHAAHDARYFASKGMPTALVGTIGANWHAQDEWADLSSVEKLRDIIYQFLEKQVK